MAGGNLAEFVELDVQDKNIANFQDNENSNKQKKNLEAFKNTLTIPPLILHQGFKVLNQENFEIQDVGQMSKPTISAFLREKMESQYLEEQERKRNAKKKKGGIDQGNKPIAKGPGTGLPIEHGGTPINLEALEIEYETMKNEYN